MKQPLFFNLLLGICLIVASFSFVSCSNSHLTNQNLNRVKNGMHEADVLALLGKPNRIETSETLGIQGATYFYHQGHADVKIVFLKNGVMLKEGTFSK